MRKTNNKFFTTIGDASLLKGQYKRRKENRKEEYKKGTKEEYYEMNKHQKLPLNKQNHALSYQINKNKIFDESFFNINILLRSTLFLAQIYFFQALQKVLFEN